VELQDNLATLQREGIQPFAINYDPVEVLASFAEKHGITYPLLSDVDSKVIRDFGILNTLVPEDHRWFGVPLPGTYMVDEHSKVFDRSFYADHGIRDSVATMLHESFSITDAARGTVKVVETPSLKASAWLSADTVRRGQIHTLTVQLDIKPGYHIYGRPIADDYIATSLSFEPLDDVTIGHIDYPAPSHIHLPVLNESLNVYNGSIVIKVSVRSRRRESFSLAANLDYQACDDRECLLPDHLPSSLPLEYRDNP